MSSKSDKPSVAVYFSSESDNLGDHVQTLGIESAVRSAFGEDCRIIRIRRDKVSRFSEPGVTVLSSGWLTHSFLPDFMSRGPSLFIGAHFTTYARGRIKERLDAGERVFADSVGARDGTTVRWCESVGVPAYFCRCFGFCVPRPKLTGDNVFVVDVVPEYKEFLPFGKNAVVMSQKRWPCIGSVGQARSLLSRYAKEARLVVTSALHAAIPCIAMGIPVVVLRPLDKGDLRFETLDGIVPVYDLANCRDGSVDFDPAPVDTSKLADDIVENLRLSVLKVRGERVDMSKLSAVRSRIASFHAPAMA